jgi:hypothetical protein
MTESALDWDAQISRCTADPEDDPGKPDICSPTYGFETTFRVRGLIDTPRHNSTIPLPPSAQTYPWQRMKTFLLVFCKAIL